MASQQLQLICDQSTYANFFQWASAVSAWLAACGWVQSTDTGQIMWSGMSLSAVGSISGSSATYTYSSLTGLALAVGRTLTITGMTHSINNGTFVITALGSGTFTITNQNGTPLSESGSTGVVTAASSVPGSAVYVYEIWTPNDGLANFYLKMEYGNHSGTNNPSVGLSISQTTNGAGTLTGLALARQEPNNSTITPPSTTITYESNFSGTANAGRISIMLWRNAPANQGQVFFAVERSLNSSGAYTGGYVTVYAGGGGQATTRAFMQQTLLFGVGATTNTNNIGNNEGGLYNRIIQLGGSSVFNGTIPIDFAAPCPGYFDYPGTVCGSVYATDITEGVPFSLTLYGSTRIYMPSKIGNFNNASPTNQPGFALCMRYD